LKRALALAHLQIQNLKAQLRLALIKKYGPGSEKLSGAQLSLLELEPGVSNVEVQAESVREPLPASTDRKSRPHPGRQELPAELPRVERVIACAPEQCTCAACGQPTTVIGYDVSEQLDVEPAKHFVVVTKREKRACKHCEEGGVAAAPVPARIIEKGLVSDGVVINTVVSKYSDHLPLYRQSAILEREAGVEISRATMDGWVMRVGELLIPIAEAMGREVAWCSTSAWGGGATGPRNSWDSLRAFCKPTAMALTIASAGRRWCMPHVGRTREGSSSRRRSSTPPMRRPRASWG
jgi:transposase